MLVLFVPIALLVFTANKGKIASTGITPISCISNTAKVDLPTLVLLIPFSFKVCNAMAVLDIEKLNAITNEALNEKLKIQNRILNIEMVVNAICDKPIPKIIFRIFQMDCGFNSSPIKNNIITTPNSEACIKSSPSSPIKPKTNGPIITPATK